MANRHFAKLADVWKHLPLVEVLAIERPDRYWESHAGSAHYPMVDDAERRFGAVRFLEVAPAFDALSRSRYLVHLQSLASGSGTLTTYAGSPLLAMRELGPECAYLFCELDPASVSDLESAAVECGVDSHTQVVGSDGMTALHEALASSAPDDAILVHIDPYDPRAVGPRGLSALALARELIDRGAGVVYWYGYNRPGRSTWAFDELRQGTSARTVWCGDIMIASDAMTDAGGDLGDATTPGTGFGVVCANVSREAIAACDGLGRELARAYADVALPDGSRGRLAFTTRTGDG